MFQTTHNASSARVPDDHLPVSVVPHARQKLSIVGERHTGDPIVMLGEPERNGALGIVPDQEVRVFASLTGGEELCVRGEGEAGHRGVVTVQERLQKKRSGIYMERDTDD